MRDMAFWGTFLVSKQIAEMLIDLLVCAYRIISPGIMGAWTGYFLPVVRRLFRNHVA